jgi:hypothetical protein
MAYELIPYPISIIFLGVFWFAVVLVLWNLRTRGKIYFALYLGGLAITILLGIMVGYLLLAGLF